MRAVVLGLLSAPGRGFGMSSRVSFAFFDRGLCVWRTSQVSLLPDSELSWPIWPRQGMTVGGVAFELPMLVPRIGGSGCSLLPTPGANDSTGAEGETRLLRRVGSRTGGPALRDLPRLLPTPVVTDSYGSRRSTARTEDWVSHPGTSLTDALWEVQGRLTDTQGNLLPTPTTQDAHNNAGASQQDRNSEALNVVAAKLLPTPVANPGNPGAGGELRAAIAHGEGRRNETGTDSFGRPNRGRPPTGVSTPTPSTGGSVSSDGQLPGQLTIEDVLSPASLSGCSGSPTDGCRSS